MRLGHLVRVFGDIGAQARVLVEKGEVLRCAISLLRRCKWLPLAFNFCGISIINILRITSSNNRYRIIYIFIFRKTCKCKATGTYVLFFLANIHNLSLVTNLNTFDKSATLLFALSRPQSINQRSNPLIAFTVYQCVSRRGSLEGGISEMRCVITGDDKEQRAEMVRFSVLL